MLSKIISEITLEIVTSDYTTLQYSQNVVNIYFYIWSFELPSHSSNDLDLWIDAHAVTVQFRQYTYKGVIAGVCECKKYHYTDMFLVNSLSTYCLYGVNVMGQWLLLYSMALLGISFMLPSIICLGHWVNI